MPNNDENPEGAGAVTPEGTEPNGTDPQDSDPLDSIQDVETLRAEAKKLRAIAAREKKKEGEVPPATPAAAASRGDFITRSDFELANQKKAVRLITSLSATDSAESKERKADILANLESVKQFYSPHRGKDTPEDIAEDLDDAYTLFRKRSPATKPDGTKELKENKIIQGTGVGATPPQQPAQDPPGYRKSKGPTDWYKKPS